MQETKVPKDILPTLIIGLGGTGYQVIKRLKDLFKKRYNSEKLPIRYLLIDTDLKSFLDDSIENNEKCQLRFGDGIKNTLDWAYSNPNFDWLPQNPPITPDFFTSTDQGAGLMRPIGRLYLAKNAKFVYDVISSAKNDLVDLHKVLTDLGNTYLENIDRHKVYIVGSLAGGTGCGTFLDVSVMLSKIFNRDNTNIIGLFTLESCYDDKLSSDLDAQNRSKANCYAALKELEFYMSSITNVNDEKYLFKYNNIGEIKLEKKLLDICYLIENKNEMGGVLTNIEDIYDLCSLQLFQEVGTKLGSQLRADYANFICKDKDPVLKKDRHFSTFSSSSMEFPIENLKSYCTLKFASEVLDTLSKTIGIESDAFNMETDKLIKTINSELSIDILLTDFTGNLRITDKNTVKELKEGKKGNLDKAFRYAADRKLQWRQNRQNSKEKIESILNEYINLEIARRGIRFATEILKKLEAQMYEEYNGNSVTTSLDRGKIENEIASSSSTKGFLKKEELLIGKEISGKFNRYIEQEQNTLKFELYKDRYNIFMELKPIITGKLDKLLSSIGNVKNDITSRLRKISHKSEKRYGGNIISREMIDKEFYDRYYEENFKENLDSRIRSMFNKGKLIEVIQGESKNLINLCSEEFEKVKANLNIMDILTKNAKSRGISLEDYIKEELDATSKLAKPFWSAIKNPEVSWTECFYIGAIRDENINNGFTIKAPEAIDRWIRNQTGERSRQARYVETTNPYSIDVIHITMGACAAYLPDIRHYKQFYLKLLSSKTYPLHLSEKYVGLDELDLDMERLFEYYSLAKAYGAILQIGKNLYLNIKEKDGKYNYIYNSPYCLREACCKERIQEVPENKSLLPESLKLGEGYSEAIKRLTEDIILKSTIQGFIEEVNKNFTMEQLKTHCIEVYIKGNKAADFISKEKILHKMSAN
jgi:hypothetical protein